MAYLMECSWPGNVRELKHVLERAVILSEGKYIRRDDMAVEEMHQLKSPPKPQTHDQLGSELLTTSKEHLESTYILGVLKATASGTVPQQPAGLGSPDERFITK